MPISQGYEFYNALKRRRCAVRMVAERPRMPHVPQEPRLLQDVMSRTMAWLEQYCEVGAGRVI